MREENTREPASGIIKAFEQSRERHKMAIQPITTVAGGMNGALVGPSTRSCRKLSWASSWVGMLAARMGVSAELRKQGYEYNHELSNPEDRSEVWVNRRTGTGVLVKWFRLPEVAR